MSILIEQLQRKLKKYQEENKVSIYSKLKIKKGLNGKLMKAQIQLSQQNTNNSFCDAKSVKNYHSTTDPNESPEHNNKTQAQNNNNSNNNLSDSNNKKMLYNSKSKSKEPKSPYFENEDPNHQPNQHHQQKAILESFAKRKDSIIQGVPIHNETNSNLGNYNSNNSIHFKTQENISAIKETLQENKSLLNKNMNSVSEVDLKNIKNMQECQSYNIIGDTSSLLKKNLREKSNKKNQNQTQPQQPSNTKQLNISPKKGYHGVQIQIPNINSTSPMNKRSPLNGNNNSINNSIIDHKNKTQSPIEQNYNSNKLMNFSSNGGTLLGGSANGGDTNKVGRSSS